MKEIIAVINQKGGVGKSTTALAIGSGLQNRKQKVLFIDLDAQGNLTFTLGANSEGITALEVLTGKAKPEEAIHETSWGKIIPASPSLPMLDRTLSENSLKIALQTIKDSFDYIIIDTPPSLSILTIIAMTTASGIVIPTQADIFSLQGISQLNEIVQAVRETTNPDLKIKGILLTRYNPRTILSRDIAEALDKTAKNIHTRLYKTKIRECIAVKEAQISRKDLFTYSPKSNGSQDYMAFIEEMLKGRS